MDADRAGMLLAIYVDVCPRCGRYMSSHGLRFNGLRLLKVCGDREASTSRHPYPWIERAPDLIDRHARRAVEGWKKGMEA